MTTIVLAHPSEGFPRFHVYAIYDAPKVHYVFAVQEFERRGQAEYVAHEMMETYEADHFRREVEVGERIG